VPTAALAAFVSEPLVGRLAKRRCAPTRAHRSCVSSTVRADAPRR
jgi:hypothetical protein